MPVYRVKVELSGVVRIEADSPAAVYEAVENWQPNIEGKKVFEPRFQVEILGSIRDAKRLPEPRFDPRGERMRA